MKPYLHDYLKDARKAMLDKVDGLCEYDARRPLTMTGTNLLGLIKHLAIWEARYFGLVSTVPSPSRCPGGTSNRNALPPCGRPSTSPARTSSTDTGECANTATRRSTPLPLMPRPRGVVAGP